MKKLYTIGFGGKSLEEFINLIKKNNIQKLVDIRLKTSSQLSGFAKSRDLKFILKIFNIDYEHIVDLAPDDFILKKYRNDKNWKEYEEKFKKLMNQRNAKKILNKLVEESKAVCLLCSENEPTKCHRRLVVELLKEKVKIVHL